MPCSKYHQHNNAMPRSKQNRIADNDLQINRLLQSHSNHAAGNESANNEVNAPNPAQIEQPISNASLESDQLPASPDRSQLAIPNPPCANETRSARSSTTPYSQGGFDILRAFQLVGMRDQPTINIGAVDLSCSFVICDVTLDDSPVVYSSTGFALLTGYAQEEALGRNCRFLQARSGQLEAGAERPGMDSNMLFWLKRTVQDRREAQCYLVNYRKGGAPFINMLSLVPIPWEASEVRYMIGFQTDVTARFRAITGRSLDFRYQNTPRASLHHHASRPRPPRRAISLPQHDRISQIRLEVDPQIQNLAKLAIENADDVICVLSLNGNFVYVSPSCTRVLEYEPVDIIGKPLAEICHSSDTVPVLRELREATVRAGISFICRIRRKESGYAWFECHGSRSAEWGTRQQYFILAARQRPRLTLSRAVLEANGGLSDGDIWSKISISGIFLFISTNAEVLLGLKPEQWEGTRIQDLVPSESRDDLERCMTEAAKGQSSTYEHTIRSQLGQGRMVRAQTSFYCGEVLNGSKPTFLLAQTKVLTKPGNSLSVPATPSRASSSAQNTPHSDIGSDDDMFNDLKPTSSTNWQFEARNLARSNRALATELTGLLANKRRITRNRLTGNLVRDCANCHTKSSPEWRRGPSGHRDLCNRCGLRWAKQKKE